MGHPAEDQQAVHANADGPSDIGVQPVADEQRPSRAHTFYGVPQNFTADKTRLKRAIDTSAFGTQIRAEGQDVGDCNCGTCRAQAITRIARALGDEPQRRKTLFLRSSTSYKAQMGPPAGLRQRPLGASGGKPKLLSPPSSTACEAPNRSTA